MKTLRNFWGYLSFTEILRNHEDKQIKTKTIEWNNFGVMLP